MGPTYALLGASDAP